MPYDGEYTEVLNCTSEDGAPLTNGTVHSKPVPMHGLEHSICIDIPAYGCLYFTVKKDEPKKKKSAAKPKTAKTAKSTKTAKTAKTAKAENPAAKTTKTSKTAKSTKPAAKKSAADKK